MRDPGNEVVLLSVLVSSPILFACKFQGSLYPALIGRSRDLRNSTESLVVFHIQPVASPVAFPLLCAVSSFRAAVS